MRNWKAMCLFLVLAALCTLNGSVPVSSREAAEPKVKAINEKVANSDSLRDVRGNRRSLHGFNGHKAVVVVFLGTECPVANLYLPGLIELAGRYRSKKVQFLGVYANENEDLNDIAAHAADRETPFPALKDVGRRLADQLGVKRVPTAVVLDGDFVLRYRGRIDDQYGVSARRPKAGRADLAEAIDEVVAGRKVTVAETEADGCLLDRARRQARTQVTYAKHVAAILQNRCQACHRPGQVGPFSLLTYGDAVKHAAMIGEVT